MRNPAIPMNFSLAALYLLPFFLSKFVCVSYQVGSTEKKTLQPIDHLPHSIRFS
ncbi:hypothetical protein [uncultured Sphaerochaeta sp.]|uniref:hypothetical protein n=1 Tax=uncultured Sphaerochaeta sp. TaxID=886478 RepID=UPI002A0A2306|nr:hypothetical protein [uncultured Sphaerochaeta sp.]